VRVFDNVCVSLAAAEIVGIVGPNGAGKTTLLRIMAGLILPTSGSVLVKGATRGPAHPPVEIAYFAGESSMPPGARVSAWLRIVSGVALAPGDKRRLGALSRGTRQAIGLRAALDKPSAHLVVLDEPWEGLDPDATRWLTSALHARRGTGAGIVVSSHRFHDLAGVCDRYGFLTHGTLKFVAAAELSGQGNRPVTADALFEMFDRLQGVGRRVGT
jgi:ABC-2 type transport system ATP-binding protein